MTRVAAIVGLTVVVLGWGALQLVIGIAIGYHFGVSRPSIWGRLARARRRVARLPRRVVP